MSNLLPHHCRAVFSPLRRPPISCGSRPAPSATGSGRRGSGPRAVIISGSVGYRLEDVYAWIEARLEGPDAELPDDEAALHGGGRSRRLNAVPDTPSGEVDQSEATNQILRWAKLHALTIEQKSAIIVEHFHDRVGGLHEGHAKAIVVADSPRPQSATSWRSTDTSSGARWRMNRGRSVLDGSRSVGLRASADCRSHRRDQA